MYREVLYADLAGALIGDVQGGIVCRFSRSINRRCTGMYCMPISPNAPTFWCRSKNRQRRNRGKRQLTEVPIKKGVVLLHTTPKPSKDDGGVMLSGGGCH